MVLIIDEAQNVKALRLDKKLSKICAEIRKYGGCVIVATQYPTAPNLPATITNNLPQKIGMKVTSDVADRVIFGGSASRNGWSPSVLIPDGRKGSFLIRNEHYGKPLLARCHYVSETDVERDNERFAPVRTPIPTISLQGISATHTREQLEPGNVAVLEREDEAEEIFDAEVLDNTESIILDLIDRQVNTPTKIQPELESFGIQLTTRSIIRHLKSMKERNLIYQSRKQGPWFRRS
jgi:DNA segregation ATPase FtsK/SpoIIIE-like protein